MKRQFLILIGLLLVVGMLMACNSENSTDDPAFEEIELAVEFSPKDALIILDRSKSMLGHQLLSGVATAIQDLTIEMEDHVNFGLMVYPGVGCTDTAGFCEEPTDLHVPFDAVNSTVDEINDALTDWETSITLCGATPTAASLEVAKAYLEQLDDGAEKLIILITDGAPNCSTTITDGGSCTCTAEQTQCVADASKCLDDAATSDAAGALKDDGIPVYVLSLGDGGEGLPTQFADVMNAIADAGGTSTALTADTVAAVETKISEIQPDLYSCELGVQWDKISDFTKESKISDYADKISLFGKESKESKISESDKISYDPGCIAGDGFDFTPDNKISLCSSLCDLLKESTISNFAATFKESKESAVAKESLP